MKEIWSWYRSKGFLILPGQWISQMSCSGAPQTLSWSLVHVLFITAQKKSFAPRLHFLSECESLRSRLFALHSPCRADLGSIPGIPSDPLILPVINFELRDKSKPWVLKGVVAHKQKNKWNPTYMCCLGTWYPSTCGPYLPSWIVFSYFHTGLCTRVLSTFGEVCNLSLINCSLLFFSLFYPFPLLPHTYKQNLFFTLK